MPDEVKQPFYNEVIKELHEALTAVAAKHPEVGSMSAVVDWKGALNDADIPFGVWVSDMGGKVQDPARIIGSAWQTLKALNMQLEAGSAYLQKLQTALTQTSKAILGQEQKTHQTNAAEQGQQG